MPAIQRAETACEPQLDWEVIAYQLLLSRELDDLEENTLVPAKEVLYQFSARGHDLSQIILGQHLTHPRDAVSGYYRSRPLMLSLGLDLTDALGGPLMRAGGYSDGRDIGVVHNLPNLNGPCGLPMSGGVGAQYTPIAGWAQSIRYHREVLNDASYAGCIGVAHGGEASCSTNGFWSALTIATTQNLPMLFYIEDNGYGISTTSDYQTPGRDIAANLASFKNLKIYSGDGTEPQEAAELIGNAVSWVREQQGPVLLRLTVPRLSGHSGQDTQGYKDEATLDAERARDPLPKLKKYLVPSLMSEQKWSALCTRAAQDVAEALERARARPIPSPEKITRHVFAETDDLGQPELQLQGGIAPFKPEFPASSTSARPEGKRINMVTAIRQTLDYELEHNPRMVVFGEDVGPKGGVHAVTLGLQKKYGVERVFDTSLSEEGIIGRALGMAQAGLLPVPEIQFRKYADPAEEQLNDCGTMRWRTNNRFAAPMVVRIPGGFFKCGDPWHSQAAEVKWAHAIGWQVAIPSNAEDAVGLLRYALRDNNPTIFFEHRNLLDDSSARRPYPGDEFIIPFGKAARLSQGDKLTLVTWGGMVPRCQKAVELSGQSVELYDLRTISPWDKDAILASVRKTGRCLIVHEDNFTAGFGAEIAATLADECFFELDAPIQRLTMPDIPSPHHPALLNAVVPTAEKICTAINELLEV
ncbi:Branched-chain alpha-keto acid dehydrogenase, E1 component, alpha subunit [Marinobacterium lacunae]|uniref:3-methyl-2-oxobutanoate dehydrogenase (2-methylpropanoyl-transferring) n=1 Tax=Marinobacterium lacunae TaxID=1232683 RepID=A0A081FXS1_9GAMM|nr:transketolase C-terminal domain-containing protein [Marinobacterium lacunae]KEA63326.1 Branched-chain alpha-keto acid dehydrogenase, E1 component, alpha subunit [Marinobacterium lacunae]